MAKLQIHFSDAAYCIGFWRNVAIVDTIGEIDAARMRRLGVAYKELLTQYRYMAVLCVLRAGAPVSPGDARAESARVASELGTALTRVAFVIEEPGVFVQLFRTVVRGFNTLTRSSKLTVDTELDVAIRSLEPLIIAEGGRQHLTTELKEALMTLRTQWKP